MKHRDLAGFTRICLLLLSLVFVTNGEAAERFFISIPGPTLSYVPLYYAQEKGFFSQEGLELHVLVVRGIIGVSSLMSGEIDVTCHAGSGFSAALRGIPIKIISVTRDRPIHELIVGPSITSSADLKGKSIAVGSLEGTAAVITRRVLQAKGLDPQKDVTLLGMERHVQASVAVYRQGGRRHDDASRHLPRRGPGLCVFRRGRDHVRYLQTGVVTTDANISQKRAKIVRFLSAWNRALKFYQDNPEVMLPYIQKKLGIKESELARRMYEDDVHTLSLTGRLSPEAEKEILDTGREALRIKESISAAEVFDFSLADDALK